MVKNNPLDKRLLIISCSKRKKPGIAPAFELYDGVVFRMLKKMRETGEPLGNINVLILSSKYGLVDSSCPIEYYDELLTDKRVCELLPLIERDLTAFIATHQPREVYCCLGETYWSLIRDVLEYSNITHSNAKGRIGEKLAELKKWILAEEKPA